MPLKIALRILTTLVALAPLMLNAEGVKKENYENIDVSTLSLASAEKINGATKQSIVDYLNKTYGDWWGYDMTGFLNVDYQESVFVKVELFLKEARTTEFVQRQRERLQFGKTKEPSQRNVMIVIDKGQKLYELPIDFDAKNKGLKFQFSGCSSTGSLASFDIDQDGKNELLLVKGYEGGFNNYNAEFDHYKLYLLQDVVFFESWLKNIDHQTLPPSSLIPPKITGLNNGNEGIFSIYYDKNNDLVKSDGLGLTRYSSLFFFNYLDKEDKDISKQLILVWDRIYRPFSDSKSRGLELDEERFKWYEGDVQSKVVFAKKLVTEEKFKAFLSGYNLSFEDGVTLERLCNAENKSPS